MDLRAWAADNLAARLLAGPWTLQAISACVDKALGPGRARTRAALSVHVYALGEDSYPPSAPALTTFLVRSDHFRPKHGRAVDIFLGPPRFAPAARFAGLAIPVLATLRELEAWLDMPAEQLDWLADERRGHARANGVLQHYRYAFMPKRDGSVRLLEAPKPRLKAIQRRILDEILSSVAVHARVHGFVAGRSCVTGAQIHAGEAVVATFDMAQFFPSIGLPRIHGLFRSLGYPWAVARRLAGLCTTITPASVLAHLAPEVQALHGVPHLAQGAPTSPALANLAAFALDVRLDGLARSAGARYTRYADDLTFSGDAEFAKSLRRFAKTVRLIVAQEGFSINPAKTRVMPDSGRQSVTGIVVNQHCNVCRADFDTLKATLHNCLRTGPAAENRNHVSDLRAHLQGRIGWLAQVNPARAEKLWHAFDRIDWQT